MLLLIGPSASGKTFIGKELEKHNFKKIVTYTTRKKRINEIDKIDYNFISIAEFKTKIKDNFFFEYVLYNDNYYGTARSSLNEIYNYLIVEPTGFLKYIKEKNVVSFYIECDILIRKERMLKRKDKIEDINKRIKNDELLFNKDIKNEADFIIDGTKDIELIIKEIKEKYDGCLKMGKNNK